MVIISLVCTIILIIIYYYLLLMWLPLLLFLVYFIDYEKNCCCSVGMNLFYFIIINFYHCSLVLSYLSHLVSLLFPRPYLSTF